MSVLMVGVDESTNGGMWSVVENYLKDKEFVNKNDLIYIPTSVTGCSAYKKILFTMDSFWKIRNLYKKKDVQILHVHMSERMSIFRKGVIMYYAKKHGSKIVLHMHGAEFEDLYKRMKPKKQKRVKNIINLADTVIILGEYWRNFLGDLLLQPEKIKVVYNAVDIPDNYRYHCNSNHILFLGAVSQRKGIHILLESLKCIEETLKDKCIVDIYGPDVEGNIKEIIHQKGLDSWVFYRGWLSGDYKKNVLEHTMFNVLPSYNEGLPMTILECMAYGVPSITTNVAAIPEAITRDNGILVRPGNVQELSDAILEMVFNKEKRALLSKKAYEDANTFFSVKQHIEIIQELYDGLIGYSKK